MQPIDCELTFAGHPDQARPLEASELFGLRIRANRPIDNGWAEDVPRGIDGEMEREEREDG